MERPPYKPLEILHNAPISEDRYGNLILLGILPHNLIRPGQKWVSSCGYCVEVIEVEENADANSRVDYKWEERGEVIEHWKNSFSFQCRYCLKIG